MGARVLRLVAGDSESVRISNRIRTARHEMRMTQDQLAAKASVSRATINAIEAGNAMDAGLATIMAIARALKVSVGQLVDDPDPCGYCSGNRNDERGWHCRNCGGV